MSNRDRARELKDFNETLKNEKNESRRKATKAKK